MKIKTLDRRKVYATLAAGAAAVGLLLGGATPANAAPAHQNTDPYNTGCAQSKSLVSSHNRMGGTLSVWQSSACGTNWTEWYGPNMHVVKNLHTSSGTIVNGGWTDPQYDTAPWSYSMQTYAPGTSAIAGTFVFDGNPVWFTCSTGCTWS
ncbi:hypothetical protein [Rathayibacter sp. VKM Ac-2760]|uniref:hypothetical protein n=1 Tax=Rathayibacter sp. VKM Ac-2760 TaxID=2609253 RepID=UPI00131968E0|nr:hypothetical protein [Rathayibacter sp. VKM Ac-2760]QHC61217.1 hypothetical protein GSU72_21085 [Rathayibacter sp. VKM Ac-2760]